MSTNNSQSLRRALYTNATFSTICGLVLSIFPVALAQFLGAANPLILRLIGIGLLLFVASLIHAATRPTISRQQVQIIIFQDLLWVVGSIALLIIRPFGLSTVGLWSVDAIAIIVGVFAYWQYRHLPPMVVK